MQVAHNVQVMPAPHSSHPDSPLLSLGMALLRVDYMISELRFKGNAYGANCSYGGGVLTLTTYADPHIKRTLDVFSALTNYVETAPWTDIEVTRGILSSAKGFIRPLRPEGVTETALSEYIIGRDYDMLNARYQTLRNATADDVRTALLNVLNDGFPQSSIGVLSSREKLDNANKELPTPLTIESVFEK